MKKTSRRIACLLLALVLVMAILPVSAMAHTTIGIANSSGKFTTYTNPDGSVVIVDRDGEVLTAWGDGVPGVSSIYNCNHAFGFDTNRDGHFIGCRCGLRGAVDPHQDPTTTDGQCWCGYTYYDIADLTVLWLSGMTLSPRFNKNTTEYTAKVWRQGMTELTGTTKTMDARATVEWPEDLTIKEGTNTFEFKVIAEDGKTTKTYTVTFEN